MHSENQEAFNVIKASFSKDGIVDEFLEQKLQSLGDTTQSSNVKHGASIIKLPTLYHNLLMGGL